MITPKEYKNQVNNGMITPTIIGEVIFSYNKRAKNMRDTERRYSKYHYRGCDIPSVKKEMYYDKKEKLLHLFNPICIHKVKRVQTKRFFDWMDDYNENETQEVWEFVDRRYDYHTFYYRSKEFFEYYLLYEIGNITFHSPLDESDMDKYKHLTIKELDNFYTYGQDVNELLSVQFCDKVYNKLMNKELKIAV